MLSYSCFENYYTEYKDADIMKFKITTLCYIEKDNCYLMLYRNKKKNDENAGKWIGIGGKLEPGESPDEGMLREVFEETGLVLTKYRFKGVISFISDTCEDEYMMLYKADAFSGSVSESCPEGELRWIPKPEVLSLPLWEGDREFLRDLLDGKDQINMKLVFHGDRLLHVNRYH